jgi:hypothetical protein
MMHRFTMFSSGDAVLLLPCAWLSNTAASLACCVTAGCQRVSAGVKVSAQTAVKPLCDPLSTPGSLQAQHCQVQQQPAGSSIA